MCFACLRDDCGKRRPNDALSTLHDSRRFFCQPATPAGNLTCGTPRAPFLARSAEHASDTLIYPSFRPLHKLRRQAQVRRLRCVAFYSRYTASARPPLRAFTARRIFSHPSPRLRTATLQRAHAPRAPKPPSPAPNAQSLATVRLVNCLKRSPFSQPLSQACASNRACSSAAATRRARSARPSRRVRRAPPPHRRRAASARSTATTSPTSTNRCRPRCPPLTYRRPLRARPRRRARSSRRPPPSPPPSRAARTPSSNRA